MIAFANKPGGYCQGDVDFLEPFANTCGNLIQAYAAMQENKRLIHSLEERVEERTLELQLANDTLAKDAATQLEHFACSKYSPCCSCIVCYLMFDPVILPPRPAHSRCWYCLFPF